LALPQLFQQRFDFLVALARIGFADQHVNALDIELSEFRAQLLAGFVLDHLPFVQQLEHRLCVGDVAEERAEHRVERLRNEFFDIPKPLDDAGRPLVVYVHDD
jgi:hypothetical protein